MNCIRGAYKIVLNHGYKIAQLYTTYQFVYFCLLKLHIFNVVFSVIEILINVFIKLLTQIMSIKGMCKDEMFIGNRYM